MDDYRVTVGKDQLVFAAAHFITFGDAACEPLHGHNYRAGASLWGGLDGHGMVYDFIALKREMLSILGSLDHRMLLPTDNPHLAVERRGEEVEVRTGAGRYLFPERDVVVLPIPNTTAEMIATWVLDRLLERIAARGGAGINRVEVEIEESPGQSGTCGRTLGD